MLPGEFWEVKSMHLKVAMFENSFHNARGKTPEKENVAGTSPSSMQSILNMKGLLEGFILQLPLGQLEAHNQTGLGDPTWLSTSRSSASIYLRRRLQPLETTSKERDPS